MDPESTEPRARPSPERLHAAYGAALAGAARLGLGPSGVWLLPNPSGLNASWQLPRLIEAYAALRVAGAQGPIG